jgi:hypothetical protein
MKKRAIPAYVELPTFTHPQAKAPFIAILEKFLTQEELLPTLVIR